MSSPQTSVTESTRMRRGALLSTSCTNKSFRFSASSTLSANAFRVISFSKMSDAPTPPFEASSSRPAPRNFFRASSITSMGAATSKSMRSPSSSDGLLADCMERSRKCSRSLRLRRPRTPPVAPSSTMGTPLWGILAKNASSSRRGCVELSTQGGGRASGVVRVAQVSAAPLPFELSNLRCAGTPPGASWPMARLATGASSLPRMRPSV
mmetsp:Transcript_21720/g.64700  ORF Transcript_21720/g.64700 Transcript_21720/m.64700 type:complete len:209 (+) Transcript_21720:125-751(+)